MKKRIISCIVSTALTCSVFCIPVIASAATPDKTSEELNAVLVKHGYTQGTAEALSNKQRVKLADQLIKDLSKVDIHTTVMEVDNLTEIQNFFSCTNEELISMGADQDKVDASVKDLNKMSKMSDKELEKEYGMDNTEAKMFRMAIENGKAIKEGKKELDNKKIEDVVTASGSITTSEMSYTQSVTNYSTPTAPDYDVTISYSWYAPYILAIFTDEIATAWGGGLNTKDTYSNASYYDWNSGWTTYVKSLAMSKYEKVQAGLEFKFPQSSTVGPSGNASKTKAGNAGFTLYQLQKKGYATNVLSNYCHRVISAGDASVNISSSPVSLAIGTSWDTTAQKSSTITY